MLCCEEFLQNVVKTTLFCWVLEFHLFSSACVLQFDNEFVIYLSRKFLSPQQFEFNKCWHLGHVFYKITKVFFFLIKNQLTAFKATNMFNEWIVGNSYMKMLEWNLERRASLNRKCTQENALSFNATSV